MRSKHFNVLGLAVVFWIGSNQLFACGLNFPNNLLDQGDKAVLVAPIADFYRELERMKLVETRFRAVPAGSGFASQAVDAEAEDLGKALKKAKGGERRCCS